jgi:site-specific recombinase XerC
MHVLFYPQGRPFLLGSQMRGELEPNAFLAKLSIVSGRTNSPRTWCSYAYQLADWLSFCEKAGLEWRRVTELNIATYRNILGIGIEPQTGRPLKRTTINHKLSVICGFYLFVQEDGGSMRFRSNWKPEVLTGPSEIKPRPSWMPALGTGSSLRLTEPRGDLQIPPREEVRRFIKSFRCWRDRLIAEALWLTGMRSAEVCSLPLNALPEDPSSIEKDTVASSRSSAKDRSGGQSCFPYACCAQFTIRPLAAARQRLKSGTAFVGRTGPLKTPAINRVFSTNCKRTGLHHLAPPAPPRLRRRAARVSSGHRCAESAKDVAVGTGARQHGNHRTVSPLDRAYEAI